MKYIDFESTIGIHIATVAAANMSHLPRAGERVALNRPRRDKSGLHEIIYGTVRDVFHNYSGTDYAHASIRVGVEVDSP
jgi:hypothetical protein